MKTNVTIQELKDLPRIPSQGPRHYPVQHDDAIQSVLHNLDINGFSIGSVSLDLSHPRKFMAEIPNRQTSEQWAEIEIGSCLTGLIEIDHADLPANQESSLQLGFLNDCCQRSAFKTMLGRELMICSNLMMTGGDMIFHRKHTRNTREQLDDFLQASFGYICESEEKAQEYFNHLKDYQISTPKAKQVLYDLFASAKLPKSMMAPIHRRYFVEPESDADYCPEIHDNDVRETAWALYGSITRELRTLPNHLKVQRSKGVDAEFRMLLN